MDLVSVAIGLLIFSLALIVWAQAKEIKVLKAQKEKYMPGASQAELKAAAAEKLPTLGIVKTVKYLREEKGMSMVEAKQLVDTLK